MRSGYPIVLDVSERTVVIIGGGAVAARKARGLVVAGAGRVRVVAMSFFDELPADVERVAEAYDERHLRGADLVFAATDDSTVNSRVVRDARRLRILVCRADDDDEHPGDFITPAVHRDGPLTVAVSAGSAALSASVRDGIAKRLDPRWARMAEAMRVLRPRVRDDPRLPPARRRTIFRDLASDEALAAALDGPESVWTWLLARHPDLAEQSTTQHSALSTQH